ncbi:hypothetical protein BIZ37_07590 [Photobacterium sp. BZF1]|uniref:hypothetical protein n=1 Tax=Photobacterium sp. BZF1 TaxID=1904457 RepID=UPI001653D2BB|nr:hypothetical protein [Photobacterium sp. BZF1]MBC7002418.1 hypothetical protein [Photobacterium sp. BZF1]
MMSDSIEMVTKDSVVMLFDPKAVEILRDKAKAEAFFGMDKEAARYKTIADAWESGENIAIAELWYLWDGLKRVYVQRIGDFNNPEYASIRDGFELGLESHMYLLGVLAANAVGEPVSLGEG